MRIYNDAMKGVPNAAILSKKAANDLLARKAAYYVHENGNLLGLGAVEDDTVLAIVSCVKGAGERIMMTLCSAVNGDRTWGRLGDCHHIKKLVLLKPFLLFNKLALKQCEHRISAAKGKEPYLEQRDK